MRPRRVLKRLLGLLALVTFSIQIALFAGCADRVILLSGPDAPVGPDVDRRVISHGGGQIEVFVARCPGAQRVEPKAFMLEFTGNATRAEYIVEYVASRWRHRPVETWVMNYPGYGGSTGPPKLRSVAPAAVATFDALKAVAGDRPIFVAGQSLGSVPALHLAAHRDVAGVIVQNPPPLRQVILGHNGWWNLWLFAGPVAVQVPRDLDSIANAKHASAPALFILAEDDQTVPLKYQRRIYDAYAAEKRQILQRGASHFAPLSPDDEARLQEAMDWLLAGAGVATDAPATGHTTRPAVE